MMNSKFRIKIWCFIIAMFLILISFMSFIAGYELMSTLSILSAIVFLFLMLKA